MNRRTFLSSAVAAGTTLALAEIAMADSATSTGAAAVCVPTLDYISAEATYFQVYEHYHLLSIPVSILVHPPAAGYSVRTSVLDQGSLDEVAFKKFIADTGLDGAALRQHSHLVHFTTEDLNKIASGAKDVEIVVMTPAGNLGHRFYFNATKSALIKIKRGRTST